MTDAVTDRRFRYGDVREDGKIFIGYARARKNPELWVSPERFEYRKLSASIRYAEKNALKPKRAKKTPYVYPPPIRNYRYGDVRADGKIFYGYTRRRKNPEIWLTQDQFEAYRAKKKAVYDSKQAEKSPKNQDTRWRSAQRNLRRRIIQKEFDKPEYPFTPSSDMNPSELTVIPNYSKFAMAPNGDVFRVDPAKRGRTAGMNNRVTPVIHPKGHQWYVQITDDFGVRRRVGVKKLMFALFGQSETIA